jgi:hypothetical protein
MTETNDWNKHFDWRIRILKIVCDLDIVIWNLAEGAYDA